MSLLDVPCRVPSVWSTCACPYVKPEPDQAFLPELECPIQTNSTGAGAAASAFLAAGQRRLLIIGDSIAGQLYGALMCEGWHAARRSRGTSRKGQAPRLEVSWELMDVYSARRFEEILSSVGRSAHVIVVHIGTWYAPTGRTADRLGAALRPHNFTEAAPALVAHLNTFAAMRQGRVCVVASTAAMHWPGSGFWSPASSASCNALADPRVGADVRAGNHKKQVQVDLERAPSVTVCGAAAAAAPLEGHQLILERAIEAKGAGERATRLFRLFDLTRRGWAHPARYCRLPPVSFLRDHCDLDSSFRRKQPDAWARSCSRRCPRAPPRCDCTHFCYDEKRWGEALRRLASVARL